MHACMCASPIYIWTYICLFVLITTYILVVVVVLGRILVLVLVLVLLLVLVLVLVAVVVATHPPTLLPTHVRTDIHTYIHPYIHHFHFQRQRIHAGCSLCLQLIKTYWWGGGRPACTHDLLRNHGAEIRCVKSHPWRTSPVTKSNRYLQAGSTHSGVPIWAFQTQTRNRKVPATPNYLLKHIPHGVRWGELRARLHAVEVQTLLRHYTTQSLFL